MWCFLSHRNDLLLSGVCVQRVDTEHFYHHSENPEEGYRYQECGTTLRDVPRPAWIPSAAQQPSTGVYQICLPGILSKLWRVEECNKAVFVSCTQSYSHSHCTATDTPAIPPFSGPFTGCQHSEPGEQAEKRPLASCWCRRVFWRSPVPWPL